MMTIDEIEAHILASNVRLIRCIYAGLDGIVRGKAFPASKLRDVMESGLGLDPAQLSTTALDQLPADWQYAPAGEIRMQPDPETFKVLSYLTGHAQMLADLGTVDGRPSALCPRGLLKRVVRGLSERGLHLQAAFENEFTLLEERQGLWTPIDRANSLSTAGMDIASDFVILAIEALEKQSVMVQQYSKEAGPGQQEITIHHRGGVLAADQQVLFRETVRGVALGRGYRISFMPKSDPSVPGNRCHIHFSLWDAPGGRNLFYDVSNEYQLSEVGRRFMGGILQHLPALLGLTAPTINSYGRLREGPWGSCYACWAPDTREASVRLSSRFRGRVESTLNLEYRPADPACNPYLALAGIIVAGLDGLDRNLDPGPPMLTNPSHLTADQRLARHLSTYPADLQAAVTALCEDSVLRNGLGEACIADYVIMKRAEIAQIGSMPQGSEEEVYQFKF
jgi:glutamine synthetase